MEGTKGMEASEGGEANAHFYAGVSGGLTGCISRIYLPGGKGPDAEGKGGALPAGP